MKCIKCGKEILPGSAFCMECGNPVMKAPGMIKMRKQLPKALWIKECPVVFSKCSIADRPDGSGEVDLVSEILNVSEKNIEAIYYELRGLDVLNEEKCDIKNIYELDMCVRPGDTYKLTKPVTLPDKTIRRIRLIIRHVCFTDETLWSYDGKDYMDGIDMTQELISPDKFETLRRIRNDVFGSAQALSCPAFTYYPKQGTDFWMCACGRFNIGETCIRCKKTKSVIFDNFSKENITAVYEGKNVNPVKDVSAPVAAVQTQEKEADDHVKMKNDPASPDKVERLFCRECGTEAQKGDAFCYNCGKPL